LIPYLRNSCSISLKTTLSLGTILFLSLFAKGDQYLRQCLLFVQCHVTPLTSKAINENPHTFIIHTMQDSCPCFFKESIQHEALIGTVRDIVGRLNVEGYVGHHYSG